MKGRIRNLTTKQQNFIVEYQRDWNGAKAAIRAGFSAKTAKEKAYALIHKNSLVKEALSRAVEERLRRKGHRADATIEGLLRVAHLDIRKIFNDDGSLKNPKGWDNDTAGAISGLDVVELFHGKGDARAMIGHLKKVRTNDRVEALITLAKIQKLIGADIQSSTNVIILEAGPVTKPFDSGMSRGDDEEIDGR